MQFDESLNTGPTPRGDPRWPDRPRESSGGWWRKDAHYQQVMNDLRSALADPIEGKFWYCRDPVKYGKGSMEEGCYDPEVAINGPPGQPFEANKADGIKRGADQLAYYDTTREGLATGMKGWLLPPITFFGHHFNPANRQLSPREVAAAAAADLKRQRDLEAQKAAEAASAPAPGTAPQTTTTTGSVPPLPSGVTAASSPPPVAAPTVTYTAAHVPRSASTWWTAPLAVGAVLLVVGVTALNFVLGRKRVAQ